MKRVTILLLLAALLAVPLGFAKGGGSSGGGGRASFSSGFSSGRGAISSAPSSHATPVPTKTAAGTFGAGNAAPAKSASALSGDLAEARQQATALKAWDASQKAQPKTALAPNASPAAYLPPAPAPVPSAPAAPAPSVVVHPESGGSNPLLWFMLGESLGRSSHAPAGTSAVLPATGAKPEPAQTGPAENSSADWLWTVFWLFGVGAFCFALFLYATPALREVAKPSGRKTPNYSLD